MTPDHTSRPGNADPTARKLARGLGWFSLALGAFELFAPRELTKFLGMRGKEPLVRLYGLREIAAGIGIFLSKNPAPWIWGRVAGDALDIGTLSAYLNDDHPEEANVTKALGNVALVTVADLYCAYRLSEEEPATQPTFDYSDRRGIPASVT